MAGRRSTSEIAKLEEEFTVWKEKTPELYDLVICHAPEWPSLTVHWSPSPPRPCIDDSSFCTHGLLLGTNTPDEHIQDFLLVAEAVLPTESDSEGRHGESLSIPRVEIIQKIPMDGEVNRAHFMPQNHEIVAVKTICSEVYVLDLSKQAEKKDEEAVHPDITLRGHDGEGFGLSWSILRSGYLLSASHDNNICIWDISAAAGAEVLDARNIYQGHENVVGDASWHPKNENLFGSVGDDGLLLIWDLRTNIVEECAKVHRAELNSLSFNSYNEWIVATASSDKTIALFDTRKITLPLHVLRSHEGEVLQVGWDPNHGSVLASASDDRRLMIWDLNRIGDERQKEDASDGPSELLFTHAGHIAKITDFAWNNHKPWVISTVAEDGSVQIWRMAENIYRDDDLLDPEE